MKVKTKIALIVLAIIFVAFVVEGVNSTNKYHELNSLVLGK